MKKHLNTLFVSTQGAYLAKEGETVVVRTDGAIRLQVPVHHLDGIVCFGNVSCSPYLLGFCAERDVAVSFLTENGRFLAKVQGPTSGNVLLRREQYRRADDAAATVRIARNVLVGKIANGRSVLSRAVRDHGKCIDVGAAQSAIARLGACLRAARDDAGLSLDALRGVEGEAAAIYFSVFDHLVVSQKDGFGFNGRNRRPPLDNINCLLSFTYTLLVHDIRSALESVGLDPSVGFLHRDRPGRPGLALDLMEEFRPVFADRLVLSLVNLKQVKPEGFVKRESGAVRMNDETRKILLTAYQKRKQEEISHPFTGEKTLLGLFFFLQARLLARHLRGDLDGYPPFISK